MISLLLPMIVVTTAAALSLVAVYAVKAGVFSPAVEPQPGLADPSAVTLAGSGELVRTVLNPPRAEWQSATLHSLAEVENLLDSLEAHGVMNREVSVVNNGTFAVRWK
jgi:hypothetical protein